MDEATKSAYRYVIYWALLRIRILRWMGKGRPRILNLFDWRNKRRQIQFAGELAEWLHNAAAFSVHDFKGFSEDRFWSEYDRLCEKYPDESSDYREIFENRLHECRTGKWPTVEEQLHRKSVTQAKSKTS